MLKFLTILFGILVLFFSTSPAKSELIYMAPPEDQLANNKVFLDTVVTGYGTDIPLAIALEIIMDGRTIANSENLSLLQLVSWRGDKSRGTILQELLSPFNLAWSITSTSVHVHTRTLPVRLNSMKSLSQFPSRLRVVREGSDARSLITDWAMKDNIIVRWPPELPSAWLGPEREFDEPLAKAIAIIMEVVIERNPTLEWHLDATRGLLTVSKF